jgi:DNA-binding YbaB/EbfC family protein
MRVPIVADIQQFMQMSQQMHRRLQTLETELASRTRECTAGGGLVRVMVDGRGTIRSVSIDPEAFGMRDAEFLSDLLLAAIAEGQRWAADLASAEYARVPDGPSPRRDP